MEIALFVIQIATLIALIIYVWKTWSIASATRESAKATEKSADISRQVLEEMRENRDQETAPYVVAYFDVLSYTPLILLAIENIGKSIANNVKLEFDPPLKSGTQFINEASFIKNNIASMPPNYKILAILDGPSYYDKSKNNPMSYKVKISYSGGLSSEARDKDYVLDLPAPLGIRIKTMDDLVNDIEKLTKSVDNIAQKLDRKKDDERE